MKSLWSFLAIMLAGVSALAASPGLSGTTSRQPVEITADSLEADDVAKTLVFIGNAVARQDDIVINGDRLTIFYASQGGDVDRILAEGKVRITQGERLATGDRVEYFRAEERMVLTGSPQVREGRNSVQGQEIVLYLKENRSVVKGGQSGRVNAVFQPNGEGH